MTKRMAAEGFKPMPSLLQLSQEFAVQLEHQHLQKFFTRIRQRLSVTHVTRLASLTFGFIFN